MKVKLFLFTLNGSDRSLLSLHATSKKSAMTALEFLVKDVTQWKYKGYMDIPNAE